MTDQFPCLDGHVHSEFSPDSESSIEAILKKAETRRLHSVAVTDHCYSPEHLLNLESRRKPGGIHTPRLILGVEVSIEMKFGVEVIRSRDRFAWDLVSAAVHGFPEFNLYPEFGLNNQPSPAFGERCREIGVGLLLHKYVQRSVEAMMSGKIDILAHPFDLFCCAGMLPDALFEAVDQLVTAAAASSTLMELNNHTLGPDVFPPGREELQERRFSLYKLLVDRCADAGVKLVPGSDAHHVDSVGEMSNVFAFLKKAGIAETFLVSTLP